MIYLRKHESFQHKPAEIFLFIIKSRINHEVVYLNMATRFKNVLKQYIKKTYIHISFDIKKAPKVFFITHLTLNFINRFLNRFIQGVECKRNCLN